MNHQKTYVGFANDHSGSMIGLREPAIRDYNNTIKAITGAASREVLDTIVSVVKFDTTVQRQFVNSNPHVLQPVTEWSIGGCTALYDGIGELIDLFKTMPDYDNPNVSFLISATTDGDENASHKWSAGVLAREIAALQRTGRWTFVLRVPKGCKRDVSNLGIPDGNIQEWETTREGMERATTQTTQAFDTYYATRASGQKSSNVFYTSTADVDTSKLADISKETSLYTVDASQNGIQVRDFILTKRVEYLIGGAFYQLTKTEPRVSPTKLILIRDKSSGKVYAGKDARTMLGLDTVNNARVHPNHGGGGYDIFIQSESVNRKLVAGTGVLYWAAAGRKLTQADLDKYVGQKAAPAVPVLPDAPATGRPTPNPVSVTTQKKQATVPASMLRPQPINPKDGGRVRFHAAPVNAVFYATRDMARAQALVQGKKSYDAGPYMSKGRRFYIA